MKKKGSPADSEMDGVIRGWDEIVRLAVWGRGEQVNALNQKPGQELQVSAHQSFSVPDLLSTKPQLCYVHLNFKELILF